MTTSRLATLLYISLFIPHSFAAEPTPQNVLRELTLYSTAEVPLAGSVLSRVTAFLWPAESGDGTKYEKMVDNLEEKMKDYVDSEILSNQKSLFLDHIRSYKQNMLEYRDSKGEEKKTHLANLVFSGNEIFQEFADLGDGYVDYLHRKHVEGKNISYTKTEDKLNENKYHYISLVSSFIPLHFAVLRERAINGEIIFGEKNEKLWNGDILKYQGAYEHYIKKSYPGWIKWRKSQFHIDKSKGNQFIDKVNDYLIMTQSNSRADSVYFDESVDSYKKSLVSELAVEMQSILYPFYRLHAYSFLNDPKEEKPYCRQPIKELKEFEYGWFHPEYKLSKKIENSEPDEIINERYTTTNLHRGNAEYLDFDRYGEFIGVSYRFGDEIDGVQFHYEKESTDWIGSGETGTKTATLKVGDNIFRGIAVSHTDSDTSIGFSLAFENDKFSDVATRVQDKDLKVIFSENRNISDMYRIVSVASANEGYFPYMYKLKFNPLPGSCKTKISSVGKLTRRPSP